MFQNGYFLSPPPESLGEFPPDIYSGDLEVELKRGASWPVCYGVLFSRLFYTEPSEMCQFRFPCVGTASRRGFCSWVFLYFSVNLSHLRKQGFVMWPYFSDRSEKNFHFS